MLKKLFYPQGRITNAAYGFNWPILLVFLGISITAPAIALALPDEGSEEISVSLNVPRVGTAEVAAIINGQQLYLSVKDVFDFLKIQNIPSPGFDSIAGFFLSTEAKFIISKASNQVVYRGKIIQLQTTGLIQTESNLYLRSDYFGEIFGLYCTFSFRNLSVTLNTKIELPMLREMKMALMHENMNRLKQERHADTIIKRDKNLFGLGVVDWSILSNHQSEGINNTNAGLGLGGTLAGGEANVFLNYVSDQPFSMNQQFFTWRHVDNNNPALKQVSVGNIYTGGIASIFFPVRGVQFTNAPTSYRRSFGKYRLSNTTEPGWMVELYVNSVLVDYITADASGFFTFEVPLVYGNSIVKLRFYGPWGEERVREQNMVIPFNFLPVKQFEYTATAGIVADGETSKFARVATNYGLTRYLTVGAGVEYLSSVHSTGPMPFLNASVRLGSSLMLTAEHVVGVRNRAILNYRLPADIQLDLNYTKYEQGQDAVRYTYLSEKKASLSIPLRGKRFTAYSRFSFTQQRFFKYKYSVAEMLISTQFAGVSANFGIYSQFNGGEQSQVYSNLSLSFRLPYGLRFTPLAQYDFSLKNWRMLRGEFEKMVFRRGFLNMAYEKNQAYEGSGFTMGFRYNLSFAQTAFSTRQTKSTSARFMGARGSLIYNEHRKTITASDQVSTRKGGLMIAPFLDLNCDGRRNRGEPSALGINLRVNGGVISRKDDGIIVISGLEAYSDYMIELDKNSFENVAWQIRNALVKVMVEPNRVKLIEVPVAVVGEVSGTVSIAGNNQVNQPRVTINIYNDEGGLVAKTITESDGYFSFLGLAPGTYIAMVDEPRLLLLHLTTKKAFTFEIRADEEGDIVDGLKFQLDAAQLP